MPTVNYTFKCNKKYNTKIKTEYIIMELIAYKQYFSITLTTENRGASSIIADTIQQETIRVLSNSI